MGGAIDGRQISLPRSDGNSTRLCTSDGCAVVAVVGVVGDGVGFGGLFPKAAICHLPKNFARIDGGIKGINFGRINQISILWSLVTVGRGEAEDERLKMEAGR